LQIKRKWGKKGFHFISELKNNNKVDTTGSISEPNEYNIKQNKKIKKVRLLINKIQQKCNQTDNNNTSNGCFFFLVLRKYSFAIYFWHCSYISERIACRLRESSSQTISAVL
jgi:hypothetical protein